MNIVRIVPQIPYWVYARREVSLYVNLYIQSRARTEINGVEIELQQTTEYPWRGQVVVELKPARPVQFALRLRIPGWVDGGPLPGDLYRFTQPNSRSWKALVNGEPLAAPQVASGYLVIDRQWQSGDRITLDLPLETRRVVAHPAVAADRGRVALVRGPLVYCAEAVDNQGSVYDLVLPDEGTFSEHWDEQLLGGLVRVEAQGRRLSRTRTSNVQEQPTVIRAIPYYAWAHRQMGQMSVWLARQPEAAEPRPLPTLASLSRPSASHCWTRDTVRALNDQLEPDSSIDHSIPRHTFWDHRGTTEWVQYDFPGIRRVSAVEVYWFDDTGRGHCRVPQSWQVLYRKEGQWLPVEALGPYETLKDRFNRVSFRPVQTDGLRLLIELQPQWSAGILEWKVLEATSEDR
ncbi:MAG: hypothetical protein KatS3mg110_3630 [Pirellulaceae bacterium]|nr:MAG: hypothetical protein KatS3mg110_3630 [Pirellulaceae bacterium]